MTKLSVLIVVVTAYIFVIITIQVFTFLRAKVQHIREISAKKEKNNPEFGRLFSRWDRYLGMMTAMTQVPHDLFAEDPALCR